MHSTLKNWIYIYIYIYQSLFLIHIILIIFNCYDEIRRIKKYVLGLK